MLPMKNSENSRDVITILHPNLSSNLFLSIKVCLMRRKVLFRDKLRDTLQVCKFSTKPNQRSWDFKNNSKSRWYRWKSKEPRLMNLSKKCKASLHTLKNNKPKPTKNNSRQMSKKNKQRNQQKPQELHCKRLFLLSSKPSKQSNV